MAKVIKGSAIQAEDNTFIFTPYKSCPEENSPWQVLNVIPEGNMRSTEKVMKVTITIKRPSTLKAMHTALNNAFVKLVYTANEKTLKDYFSK